MSSLFASIDFRLTSADNPPKISQDMIPFVSAKKAGGKYVADQKTLNRDNLHCF
jgi:hypothetical protein